MISAWNKIDGLLYEKELLPVGPVTKWVSDANVQHVDIKPAFLERVVEQFRKFKDVGIRVPLFKTHVEDPDNDRGTVEDLEVKTNQRGKLSLFSKIRFSSEEAANQGKNVDVSVLCPPKFVDGQNNEYTFPLRHVALTSMPVVPGLQPFEAVVMSFDMPSELTALELAHRTEQAELALNYAVGGVGFMPGQQQQQQRQQQQQQQQPGQQQNSLLAKIAQMLGLQGTPSLDAVISALRQSVAGQQQQPGQQPGQQGACQCGANGVSPVQMPQQRLSFSQLSPVLLRQLRTAREQIIDGMVRAQEITPALAGELKAKFTGDEALAFDLSSSSTDATNQTEFERTCDFVRRASKDRPLANSGRTTVKLGYGSDDENVPATVRDARARAAAAATNGAAK